MGCPRGPPEDDGGRRHPRSSYHYLHRITALKHLKPQGRKSQSSGALPPCARTSLKGVFLIFALATIDECGSSCGLACALLAGAAPGGRSHVKVCYPFCCPQAVEAGEGENHIPVGHVHLPPP